LSTQRRSLTITALSRQVSVKAGAQFQQVLSKFRLEEAAAVADEHRRERDEKLQPVGTGCNLAGVIDFDGATAVPSCLGSGYRGMYPHWLARDFDLWQGGTPLPTSESNTNQIHHSTEV
jgi:hypothetical protein